MSYQEALDYLPPDIKAKYQGDKPYRAQAAAFKQALDTLARTLRDVKPDITIIISDDQDEWFYDHNMPRFSIYWGDSVPLRPRPVAPGGHPEIAKAMVSGYGDVPMDVPVASQFGRYLLEYLCEHDFDIGFLTHPAPTSGGKPASDASCAIRRAESGVAESGLRTTVQPAARAGASFQVSSSSGEFHGVIAATTPTGSRRV